MTDKKKLVIAIDGPAGAGKSTIAAHLARKLGYINLESGAMYRALGLKALETGTSLNEGTDLYRLAEASKIELIATPDGNRVMLDGRDVSQRIRERDVTDAASRVSTHSAVRGWMVSHQRDMGARGGVIMEGRDIGTVVFPNAEVKIFLDADQSVRAGRRIVQQNAQHDPERAGKLVEDLKQRDLRDTTRDASPLRAAEDAVHIDSTGLTIEQVTEAVEKVVEERLKQL